MIAALERRRPAAAGEPVEAVAAPEDRGPASAVDELFVFVFFIVILEGWRLVTRCCGSIFFVKK